MVIINYLVCDHEPKITFEDNTIRFSLKQSDELSFTRNIGTSVLETERKINFKGIAVVELDLDNAYQLNLTKR